MGIWKFNSESTTTEEWAKNTSEYRLLQKMAAGERISIEELGKGGFGELWNPDTYSHGVKRLGGWCFDYAPYLKRFLIRERYSGWREVMGYNKMAVRKLAANPSQILEIVEIPKKSAA